MVDNTSNKSNNFNTSNNYNYSSPYKKDKKLSYNTSNIQSNYISDKTNTDNDNNNNSNSKYNLLSKNYKILSKNYVCHLNYLIGSGTFGRVLYATNIDSNIKTEYAIKLEKSNVKSSVIELEYNIYNYLSPHEGIPKLYSIGEYKKYKFMVIELLGPSLDKFFIACNKLFSPLTAALLGDQMTRRVHYVHSKGFVHRDIKPNNFMLGKFSAKNMLDLVNEKTVYIIDFGLSKEYIDPETNAHYPFKDCRRFIGTPRYASINTHMGYKQSRRDDLESIAYILIYFVLGELPWQGVKAKSKSEKKEKIKNLKIAVDFNSENFIKNYFSRKIVKRNINKSCDSYSDSNSSSENNIYYNNNPIPIQFIKFLEYVRKLKYEEKPDYNYIYKLLNSVTADNSVDGYDYFDYQKHIWEWNLNFLTAYEGNNSLNCNDKLNRKNKEYEKENYKLQYSIYHKLYDGYPCCSFNDYLKRLNYLVNSSSNILATTSSTTSNTNPNNLNIGEDISNNKVINDNNNSSYFIEKLKIEDNININLNSKKRNNKLK